MRFGIDIGIHAQRDPGHRSHLARHLVEQGQFLRGLDIEHEDIHLEGFSHLLPVLPDAREDDALGRNTGGERPKQLATRDDVRAAAHRSEQLQNGQVGVGLECKADQMRHLPKGLAKDPKVTGKRGVAIQIKWGPDRLRKDPDGDLLTVQVLTPILKMMHG